MNYWIIPRFHQSILSQCLTVKLNSFGQTVGEYNDMRFAV